MGKDEDLQSLIFFRGEFAFERRWGMEWRR
jgi:hypothetical protein